MAHRDFTEPAPDNRGLIRLSKSTAISPLSMQAVETSSWALGLFGLAAAWFLPVPQPVQLVVFLAMLGFLAYVLVFFRWLYWRPNNPAWIKLVPTYANIGLVALMDYLIGGAVNVEALYVLVVVNAAIRLGRRDSMVSGSISALASVIVDLLRPSHVYSSGMISTALVGLAVWISGYLAGALADVIRRQQELSDTNTRNLSLLLDANKALSSSLDMAVALPRLAELVARGLPVTMCRISLFDARRDQLVNHAAHPLRLLGAAVEAGHRWSLNNLPLHREALAQRRILVVEPAAMPERLGALERDALLFADVKSVCLAPLVFEGQAFGVITLGEARALERERFDAARQALVESIAAQAAAYLNNAYLHQAVQRQSARIAALNEVARAVGSTLDMDRMLVKIYEQLHRIVSTDTYYVGIRDPASEFIELRIVFDEGVNFPPFRVKYGDGLASLVVRRREPLLVRKLSEEGASLPVAPVMVGGARLSESWLGVPVVMSDDFTGLLVIASYEPYAFDEDDVALLTNIAGQVALALDNARRHAQVEAQARQDSLTGALNHGSLLADLETAIQHARGAGGDVSFIMFDIDFFKPYNDTYGHVMGDRVLRLAVQAIRAHVKQTDSVGRWGGEEFAIVLPGASSEQAAVVAQRIRETLAGLQLQDDSGKPIPTPTASQGIATFPAHADSAARLIDIADAMLYESKRRGRDQIQVASRPA